MAHDLRRVVALILLAAVLAGAGSMFARAQGADELELLYHQVMQHLTTGKYAEGVPIAERALALAERRFGSNGTEVATFVNNLAELYTALVFRL